MKVTKEMQLLRDKLDEMGIKWEDYSESLGDVAISRTWFRDNRGNKWSVIHGFGTMGGYDGVRPDEGLLEIWDWDMEPIGYLTADDITDCIFEGRRIDDE